MLYAHARECGADTREGHEAISIEQRSPRDSCLEVRTDEGRGYRIEARYVVDASGRDAFLAAKRRRAGALGGGCGVARAGDGDLAPHAAREAAACRDGAILVIHLPLQRAGHA